MNLSYGRYQLNRDTDILDIWNQEAANDAEMHLSTRKVLRINSRPMGRTKQTGHSTINQKICVDFCAFFGPMDYSLYIYLINGE